MAKANLRSQAKRKRELAKQDKLAAKDQKRAGRKADARTARGDGGAPAETPAPGAKLGQLTGAQSVKSLAAAAFIRRLKGSA